MDDRSKQILKELVRKTPEELNKTQREFMKARRTYLTEPQTDKFDSILNPKPPKKETVNKNAKNKK